MPGSPLTTHVLDTARGTPASNLPVTLYFMSNDKQWEVINASVTNADGRVNDLISQDAFTSGVYKLNFDTESYNKDGFYPFIDVVFTVRDPSQHHHVPILLSPFGYTTYRGS